MNCAQYSLVSFSASQCRGLIEGWLWNIVPVMREGRSQVFQRVETFLNHLPREALPRRSWRNGRVPGIAARQLPLHAHGLCC